MVGLVSRADIVVVSASAKGFNQFNLIEQLAASRMPCSNLNVCNII